MQSKHFLTTLTDDELFSQHGAIEREIEQETRPRIERKKEYYLYYLREVFVYLDNEVKSRY